MCQLDGEMMDAATGPAIDPRDHFVSQACGRIARGEVEQMDVDDLKEVVLWLNEEIYYRVNPYIPPANPF